MKVAIHRVLAVTPNAPTVTLDKIASSCVGAHRKGEFCPALDLVLFSLCPIGESDWYWRASAILRQERKKRSGGRRRRVLEQLLSGVFAMPFYFSSILTFLVGSFLLFSLFPVGGILLTPSLPPFPFPKE